MALNFPNNPSLNETFTGSNGLIYVWDGTKWITQGSDNATGAKVEEAPQDGTVYGRVDANWQDISTTHLPLTGGALTGSLDVPAGASGAQAPQVQEVVQKTGDTMTGDLTVPNLVSDNIVTDSIVSDSVTARGSIFANTADGTVSTINLDGTTGNGTFAGNLYAAGIVYTGYSGVMKQSWNPGGGGIISQIVDSTTFRLCYSAGNNITWAWNTSNQVVATIDGVVSVVCGVASDYRLKENVELSTYGTDAVKALNPVSYTLKESGESAIGFIAHEAAEAVPGAATGEKDGEMMQSINTYPIVATLTKALQESIERIEALEAKVQTLENNQ